MHYNFEKKKKTIKILKKCFIFLILFYLRFTMHEKKSTKKIVIFLDFYFTAKREHFNNILGYVQKLKIPS